MRHRLLLGASLLLLLASCPAAFARQLDLSASPRDALFDVPVRITARTAPFASVTIEATAQFDGMSYRSWGYYRANRFGLVDVATSKPIAGTYAGADAMGLFWSMTAEGKPTFSPSTLQPFQVRLTLYSAEKAPERIALTRRRIGSGIERTPLDFPPVVGTLFQVRNATPIGLVIVFGGSEGGEDENRAAIIASHGFDAVAVAYFGMKPLSDRLANIPLEYVDGVIAWARTAPAFRGLPIILEGDSKGAELALLAASRNSSVAGVVAFAPSSEIFEGFSTPQGQQRASWSLAGAPVPFANNVVPQAVRQRIHAQRVEGRPVAFRDQYLAIATPSSELTAIHVEAIRGPILLVAGADDKLWPSDIFAQRIVRRRQAYGVAFADKALVYADAGHQLDVPYMPTTGLSAFQEQAFTLALGGTAAGYARADAAMWPSVIAFLRDVCQKARTGQQL